VGRVNSRATLSDPVDVSVLQVESVSLADGRLYRSEFSNAKVDVMCQLFTIQSNLLSIRVISTRPNPLPWY